MAGLSDPETLQNTKGGAAQVKGAPKAAARGGGAAATPPDGDGGSGSDEDGSDSEGLPSVETPFCVLLSCLHNDREAHMITGAGPGGGPPDPDPLMLMGPGSDDDDAEPPALVPLVRAACCVLK